jgi:hypothetical protein
LDGHPGARSPRAGAVEDAVATRIPDQTLSSQAAPVGSRSLPSHCQWRDCWAVGGGEALSARRPKSGIGLGDSVANPAQRGQNPRPDPSQVPRSRPS